LLKEILEFEHHEVQVADGGRAGLDAFQDARNRNKPFDAVITDLGMPDVNGRQVAEKIKAASPRTTVIMLTGWGAMLQERGQEASLVDAILSKPPRPSELVQTLTRLAGK
jgi:CheY-like chemotaxis protein